MGNFLLRAFPFSRHAMADIHGMHRRLIRRMCCQNVCFENLCLWRKKLREYQNSLETLRAKYNELTMRYNDSKSTAERGTLRIERDQIKSEMDQFRIQIDEAKNMLDKKIPEEADLYKAKPDWVK